MTKISATVDVDINLGELLEAIDDDDLLEEVEARDLAIKKNASDDTQQDVILDLRRCIEKKHWDEALALFDRTFDERGDWK